MDKQLNYTPTPEPQKIDPYDAAIVLGKLLRKAPEYTTYLDAVRAFNNDLAVQKLRAQMRGHQNALRWISDGSGEHAAELARLELELNDMPVVKEYREAEMAVRQMFGAVDEIISRQANVAFAANARRSGCCG